MCQCNQSHFNVYLVNSTEHEPLEVHVLLDVSKDRLHIPAALFSFGHSQFAQQAFFGFFPVPDQIVVAFDDAVLLGLMAHSPQGAAVAVLCLIALDGLEVACFCCALVGADVLQLLPHGTVVAVLFFIVVQIIGMKGVRSFLSLALFFMEVVVFDKGGYLLFFECLVVFFAAITGICGKCIREFDQSFLRVPADGL